MPVYIREYEAFPNVGLPVAPEPSADQSALAISATSAASAAFGPKTKYVRVFTTEACHFVFGASPTATTGNAVLGANTEYWASVQVGHALAARTT